MKNWMAMVWSLARCAGKISAAGALWAACASVAAAQGAAESGEANLKLPDLSSVQFMGIDGHRLLLVGIVFCILGLVFGLVSYTRLKNLPVHKSMLRNFRADLRDVQNLPVHPGQVHSAAGSVHRRGDRSLFRRTAEI